MTDIRQDSSITSAGTIYADSSILERQPYEHQREAMRCLDVMNRFPTFSTMVVLPTGGGKTYTASNWLLRNAINEGRKVLWVAHRHMLLDQAAESFARFATPNALTKVGSFDYRIVSGSERHCRSSQIKPSDTLLVASKDSLRGRSSAALNNWLRGQQELFLVVDEAHHAAAKTYRALIEYIRGTVPRVKIIGLTATPLRTAEREQGILAQIFPDGIVHGRPAHNSRGIAYQIGLQDLINRQILARPIMKTFETGEVFGDGMAPKELELMVKQDRIPEKLARQIVENAPRNRLIVDTYAQNRDLYGQTLVFAVNIPHAQLLNRMFNEAGVKSGCVVSNSSDVDGTSREYRTNQQVIDAYKRGDLDVLVNVNILTEGTDLPKTQTVFLARPTSSTVLMTQMVGRALRGVKAGGTAEANIVSFVDGWGERVAWTNPTTLFAGSDASDEDHVETEQERRERMEADLQAISMSKITEFASIADSMVNTELLERVPFIERIPVGMYVFSYVERSETADDGSQAEGSDISCQVMVYSSTQEAYKHMLQALPDTVHRLGLDDEEFADDATLDRVVLDMERAWFDKAAQPPYRVKDIESVVKYFLQFGQAPSFYPFDTIDRARLDVGQIARDIYDRDLGPRAQGDYVNKLWDSEDENLLKLFFTRKEYFLSAVELELRKLAHQEMYGEAPVVAEASHEAAANGAGPIAPATPQGTDPTNIATGDETSHAGPAEPDENHALAGESPSAQAESPHTDGRTQYSPLELHPAAATYEAFPRYEPAGIVCNRMTDLPIKKFGGKAKVLVAGNTTTLFSHGFRTAEYDPANGMRLLSYEIEGVRHGWDENRHVFAQVQDFVASRLGLGHAPSHEEVEALAEHPGSGLSIVNATVREREQAPSSTSPAVTTFFPRVESAHSEHTTYVPPSRGAEKTQVMSPIPEAALTTKLPGISNRQAEIPTRGAAETTVMPAISASRERGKQPRYPAASNPLLTLSSVRPRSKLSQEEFELLGVASKKPTALNTDYGKHARILHYGGTDYLYVDRLKMAEWSAQEGLTLYEYTLSDGSSRLWSNSAVFTYIRDFASERSLLRRGEALTPGILMRKARNNTSRFHLKYITGLNLEESDETGEK